MFSRMSLMTNYTLLFSIISYKTTTYILHAILLYIDNQVRLLVKLFHHWWNSKDVFWNWWNCCNWWNGGMV